MKALIDKGINTIKYDGLKVFTIRIVKYSIVRLKRLFLKKDLRNIEKWKALKDKYKGERVFVVGNGPSLNEMALYLLEDEYTVCFNRFNLMFERLNWLPDFYSVCDDLVIKDMYSQVNTEILPNVEFAFFPDLHPSNVDFTKYVEHRENVYWLNTDKPEFSANMPDCGINKTVVNFAIQVMAYVGFSEIYLIGVDMSFADQKVKKLTSRNWVAAETDPNHFDPRYFGKGLKYHNPTVPEMIEKFETGRAFFDKRNVKIFNAGYGGKLEVFPRVQFDSLFNIDDAGKEALLASSKILTSRNLNFKDVLSAPQVTEQGIDYPPVFKTDNKLGVALIPKLILDYLPLGPYQNQFFFIKR